MGEHQRSKTIKKLFLLAPAILILIGAGVGIGIGGWLYVHRSISPVPKSIAKSVNFDVYYPEQKKLPAGYTLDLRSFASPQKGVVIYSVDYGNGKKLVFSVQQKPSDSDIAGFYANHLSLHTNIQLPAGAAASGAINTGNQLRSLVSISTNTNAWILITGPPDINQSQLKQVLQAIVE